jgi:hypothetical protein
VLDIILTYGIPVAAAVVGFIAGRTRNKTDDLAALALADPEVRELVVALKDRLEELKEEVDEPAG